MQDFFAGINHLAVLVATIAYYFIGFVWYSLLFKKTWVQETGVFRKGEFKPTPVALIGQFVSVWLYALGIALILKFYGNPGIKAGICVGLFLSVFVAIPMYTGNLFFTGKRKLFLIDSIERAIGTVVTAIIISAW